MKKLSPILMLDNHLMPLPTPDSAESVDAPMITAKAVTIAMVDIFCPPSSVAV